DPAELRRGVGAALGGSDLVVAVGGVSMGDKDHLPAVFESLGVERLFHGVSVQPGKPVWAGRRGGCFVLGLPGNPVSSFVILELFGVPLVQRLGGAGAVVVPRPLETGVCASSKGAKKRPRFVLADLETDGDGRDLVRARPEAGSGDWTALAGAQALVFLAPGSRGEPGHPVRFLRLA
ncbi:MAG: molybdopterin molybdenumtransferase MoeA, partial [Planctomycetes bacterium]|nr:molybdopterin molybdenumtransferase MoeA [Planctomycetota bacterium]